MTTRTVLRSILAGFLSIALLSPIAAGAQDDPEQTQAQASQTGTTQAESVPETGPTLRARPVVDQDPSLWSALQDDQRTILIEFAALGAGIEKIKLLDETISITSDEPVILQERTVGANGMSAVPFASLSVTIDGETVYISGSERLPVWRERSEGVFECVIEDDQGSPVLRVVRTFVLRDGMHGFTLEQSAENLTDEVLVVSFAGTTMIDVPRDENGYAGDRRRFRTGTMRSPERQGESLVVTIDDDLLSRNKVLGKRTKDASGVKSYQVNQGFWPSEEDAMRGTRLSWYGFADRYHAVLVHPVFDPATSSAAADRLLLPDPVASGSGLSRLVLNPDAAAIDATMVLVQGHEDLRLEPGSTDSVVLGVYAGPRTKPLFLADPILAALNTPEMVVYNLGGICAACTFDWLTHVLIGVLRVFHSITFDWALSIMLLVVLVRGCLHPVTRWSQIRMQRFGVQMQSMAPKQKALREKFKDDPKRMQAEMTKLWREEGVSPTGMLGCLPMFLQSPVWIALYATLFYAYDLRQQPAFYGVFQNLSGGSWNFLADLSRADGAIPLPESMHFSFALWGTVDAINLLPLFMGVVFFIHQKFMTPPTQGTMTPEQESQQKMMKVMMVVMFPIMMYTAPSGLSLYFITNSTLGIFESKWIRAHMEKHGMLEIENIRAEKAKKGPGFLQRMTQAAEAQRQIKERGPAPMNPASRQNQRRK